MTTFDESDSDSNNDEEYRGIRATYSSEDYTAETIRAEFKTYQKVLPKPDKLLQNQHSVDLLRDMIKSRNIKMPRFLKLKGDHDIIKPHYALCCLLLDDMSKNAENTPNEGCLNTFGSWAIWFLSFGLLYRQQNMPADVIREQFFRVGHMVGNELISALALRTKIRNHGIPIPNYFLDPEDGKQFPPHIALLVILQDGEKESEHMAGIFNRMLWFSLAFVGLLLRLVLEVIGGAGAIWGGAEVFTIRHADNAEQCRYASIAVGIFCLFRFIVLNVPHKEDEGDTLGPAGPWSLHSRARLRAVTEHPFHYFVRARRPYLYKQNNPKIDLHQK